MSIFRQLAGPRHWRSLKRPIFNLLRWLSPCTYDRAVADARSPVFTAVCQGGARRASIWVCLQKQTCYTSAPSMVSEMSTRKYLRGAGARAAWVATKTIARALILITASLRLDFAGCGCFSQKSTDRFFPELTRIPAAAQGGREKCVENVRLREQIASYARSRTW